MPADNGPAKSNPILMGTVPIERVKLYVTLEGEAAMRLSMWAEQQGMHKNLAAKKMLIAGMKDMGLLLKIYE